MSEIEQFLELYRKYESLVRELGYQTAKEYEDTLTVVEKANKLRFCRTVRNFLAHEEDAKSFATVSSKMISFMTDLVYELDNGEIPVYKKMVSVSKCFKESDTVADAVAYMLKKKIEAIPVFMKNGDLKGIFSSRDLMTLIAMSKYTKTLKLSAVPLKSNKNDFAKVDKMYPIKETFTYLQDSKVVLVVDNNKIIGTFIK